MHLKPLRVYLYLSYYYLYNQNSDIHGKNVADCISAKIFHSNHNLDPRNGMGVPENP